MLLQISRERERESERDQSIKMKNIQRDIFFSAVRLYGLTLKRIVSTQRERERERERVLLCAVDGML